MPRDLGDVLHYFLPEAEPAPAAALRASSPRERRPAALPLVGLPIGERDVVRAALAWNLAVEVARLGGRAVLVAPESDEDSGLFPPAGCGPLGAEVVFSSAREPRAMHRDAIDVAVERAAEAPEGGVVFVRIPPAWLRQLPAATALVRWTLLFASSETRDVLEAYGIAKLLLSADPGVRIGVTIHGARRRAEAEETFARISRSAARHLGHEIRSYGLLVDDLHVFRAIVARRPIGLAHPQSPAARALRDVAGLILEDAQELAVV